MAIPFGQAPSPKWGGVQGFMQVPQYWGIQGAEEIIRLTKRTVLSSMVDLRKLNNFVFN